MQPPQFVEKVFFLGLAPPKLPPSAAVRRHLPRKAGEEYAGVAPPSPAYSDDFARLAFSSCRSTDAIFEVLTSPE